MTTLSELRPHRWNPGFEWTPHAGPYQFLSEAQVQQFDERGFFVIDAAFTADELAPIRAELDIYDSKVEHWLDKNNLERAGITEKGAITFAAQLAGRNELLAQFVRHPILLGIARDILGPDVNLYWDQAVYKKPEKPRRFPWHQDTGYKVTLPQDYLTCWIAISDATIDHGCPQVAPGVHRQGTIEHAYVEPLGWECFEESPTGVEPAPVMAGGIVVFSSLTPHFTGPNTTDEIRRAYIVQYAREGTVAMEGEPDTAPEQVVQDDATFQFPVLRGGQPVT